MPTTAWQWALLWAARGKPSLATDLETPDKSTDEEEAEINAGTLAGTIYRIGFAYRWEGVTYALSIPWGGEYTCVVRWLLSESRAMLVWNRHFDLPRLRVHGVVAANWHDVQEMWHLYHTDLKKSLEFAAPFLVPAQPYWKDQSHQRPAYYNAIDAAITAEGYEVLWGNGLSDGTELLKQPELPELPPCISHDSDIPF